MSDKSDIFDTIYESLSLEQKGKCESFLLMIYLGLPQGEPPAEYLITTCYVMCCFSCITC